ncbi:MAG: protein-arginine deiminase family protein [Myxococcota bacterium]
MKKAHHSVLASGVAWFLMQGCQFALVQPMVEQQQGESPPEQPPDPPPVIVDLVADNNRNGVLDEEPTEEAGEETWSHEHGAVFLSNLDDDDDNGVDAHDTFVNGNADITDLAPVMVRAWPDVPADATGTLVVTASDTGAFNLFKVTGVDTDPQAYAFVEDASNVPLTAEEIRAGVRFALEATDLVTSTSEEAWDGHVTATLTIRDAQQAVIGTDEVQLRVAPVIFQYNTLEADTIFYSDLGPESAPLLDGLDALVDGQSFFHEGLDVSDYEYDQWAQDFFDMGQMYRPGANGVMHGMRVAVRSAQPDRRAGRLAQAMLGPDVATLYVRDRSFDPWTHGYSMNSFGNWDVVPPYTNGTESYPAGRNIWGAGSTEEEMPDGLYVDMVRAQRVQPEIVVDTSWLSVGHVDEVMSFVKTNTPRGWGLLLGSTTLARDMLQRLKDEGHGDVPMFVGKSWVEQEGWSMREVPAEVTVSEALADADLMAESQESQIHIDEVREVLVEEIGLADEEITLMPFLMERTWGASGAYQPGTVNLLHANGRVVIPDPFGPELNGEDVFKADLRTRLGALGLTVMFADDWDLYHRLGGEVHCGTNAARRMEAAWWVAPW